MERRHRAGGRHIGNWSKNLVTAKISSRFNLKTKIYWGE